MENTIKELARRLAIASISMGQGVSYNTIAKQFKNDSEIGEYWINLARKVFSDGYGTNPKDYVPVIVSKKWAEAVGFVKPKTEKKSERHPDSIRVKLKKSLTEYHPQLEEGIEGWTIPDKKNNPPNGLDNFGIPYAVVLFDNGLEWGIALNSLVEV